MIVLMKALQREETPDLIFFKLVYELNQVRGDIEGRELLTID